MFEKKRFILLLLMLSVLFGFTGMGQIAYAADKPSQWAEPEVYGAIEKALVPQILQGKYQTNIKRYEYVLLALEIYDLSGKEAELTDDAPFSDAVGHAFEYDIVRAYNAGIIKGDGKGNFLPDKNITREEIASLVVNLLKQVSPERDYTLKGTYEYADRNKIADWAAYYIDYCYENKILNGYSGNIMDPKGNATIEQAIALLYRLANAEYLLESRYGTLKLSDTSLGKDTPDPQIVNEFVETYDIDTFNALKQLSKNQDIGIMSLWEKSATVSVGENTITLNSPDFEKNLFALVGNASNELFASTYRQLLGTYDRHKEAMQLFDDNLPKMKAGEVVEVFVQMNDTDTFRITTLGIIDSQMSYKISFVQTKP